MSSFRMWEVFQRSKEGPWYRDQNEYLIKRFMPKMKEVVKKYEIKWDGNTPINLDDNMADSVWKAAKEFFIDVGVYNIDTRRVILFSEEEVNEVLVTKRHEYQVGAGFSQRRLGNRKVEDPDTKPFFMYSPDMSYSYTDHKRAIMAYLKEPLMDGLCAPLLEDFMGQKAASGEPTEVASSMEHAMNLRDAQRLIGKPDIFTVSVGTAETDVAQVSAANKEWGVRPSHLDGRMVSILTEMSTSYSMLNRSLHYRSYGNVAGNLAGAIYGGFAGGSEGTAVLQAAYNIEGACLYGSQWTLNFPFNLKWQTNTGREMLWIVSIVSQALSRNSKLIFLANLFANAGPGTDQVYYEAIAYALTAEVSGANLWGTATCRNKFHDRATPLEARMAAETALASFTNRMTREEATEVVEKLLAKYDKDIPTDNYGYTIQEVYDLDKIIPRPEFLAQFKRIKEEAREMGIKYIY